MIARKLRAGSAAVAVVVLLAGCSSVRGVDPASSQAPAQEAHPEVVSVAGGGPDVQKAAAETVRRWGRPTVAPATWWTELAPLLSQSGQGAYAETDSTQVPALKVRGTKIKRKDGDYYAVVRVSTDHGPVDVELTRPAESGWLMVRMDLSRLRDVSLR